MQQINIVVTVKRGEIWTTSERAGKPTAQNGCAEADIIVAVMLLSVLRCVRQDNLSQSWQELLLCDIVTCCSQAAWTCCSPLFFSVTNILPLPAHQAGVRPACLAAPDSLFVAPLLLFGLFLFLCLCLFPVAPSIFPLSQFYPTIPQFFSECQA